MDEIKLVAFDLDGTLTQHKTPLGQANRAVLDALGRRYKLLMVGAGGAQRIFRQLEGYPIDIIGNYGMQFGRFNPASGELDLVRNDAVPCDRDSVRQRVARLREAFGYTSFAGESVEFHDSGCVTFPLLGTKAAAGDKLRFDPDRSIRRRIYAEVAAAFPEFVVFVGGSSSFDMAPKPHDKYHALARYCAECGLAHSQAAYAGDDYGPGGNDESVYHSDIRFFPVDDYTRLAECLKELLA